MLTNSMAESISLFSLIRACRENPAWAQQSPAVQLAAAMLRKSDNPAIRAKAARLVPERITDVPAA